MPRLGDDFYRQWETKKEDIRSTTFPALADRTVGRDVRLWWIPNWTISICRTVRKCERSQRERRRWARRWDSVVCHSFNRPSRNLAFHSPGCVVCSSEALLQFLRSSWSIRSVARWCQHNLIPSLLAAHGWLAGRVVPHPQLLFGLHNTHSMPSDTNVSPPGCCPVCSRLSFSLIYKALSSVTGFRFLPKPFLLCCSKIKQSKHTTQNTELECWCGET